MQAGQLLSDEGAHREKVTVERKDWVDSRYFKFYRTCWWIGYKSQRKMIVPFTEMERMGWDMLQISD